MIRRLLGLLSGRHEGDGERPAAEHRVVHGLPVRIVNTRPDIETEQVIQRLTEALDLIATYAPGAIGDSTTTSPVSWSSASPAGAPSFRSRASAWWS